MNPDPPNTAQDLGPNPEYAETPYTHVDTHDHWDEANDEINIRKDADDVLRAYNVTRQEFTEAAVEFATDAERDPVDGTPTPVDELPKGETAPKGAPTPKAPQNQPALRIPGTLVRAFTGELDFGVVKRESVGDVALMQMNAGIAGGVITIEFPAGFTPQVIEGLKQAFVEWCESDPNVAADQAARARAAAAGIEVPVIQVPGTITSEQMRQVSEG